MITFVKQFGGDAIVVTCLQRHHVRFDDFFTFFEFLLNPVPRVVDRPVKKPLNYPECKNSCNALLHDEKDLTPQLPLK